MKWIIIALLMINVAVVYGRTETVTLDIGESYLFDGKNVSLVDSSEDSVVICVNKEKKIVSNEKTFNELSIDLKSSNTRNARFSLNMDCDDFDDCRCDGNECDNNLCFDFKQSVATTTTTSDTITTTTDTVEEVVTTNEETTTTTLKKERIRFEDIDNDKMMIIGGALLIIAAVLGIVAWIVKR